MGIVWVRETGKGRESSLRDNGREYTRRFLVKTDSVLTGPVIVQTATAYGLPELFQTYTGAGGTEFDTGAVCREIRPRQSEESHYLWEVECKFATITNNKDFVIDPAT